LLDELANLPESDRRAYVATLTTDEQVAIPHSWRWLARPDQRTPPGDWLVWLLLAGRGFGKTRTGAEFALSGMLAEPGSRWALVARKLDEVRTTMVEGESGLLAVMPEALRNACKWNRGTCELYLPNGSQARGYTAEEPKNLRGPQHHGAWCDELAQWRDAPLGSQQDTTWSNLMLGLRLGTRPRCVVTTTPKPFKLIRDLLASPDVVVTRGTTYDNLPNLAGPFRAQILSQFEGTRLGRQELNGELLEDVVGALWWQAIIEPYRLNPEDAPKDLLRIVVAIDPAVSTGDESAETGIVVGGIDNAGHSYVLADASGQYSPLEWANRAVNLYREWRADRIIGEVNNGGDLVEANIRSVNRQVPFSKVTASRGKAVRAEPIASLYEQGRFHHVGLFPELEDQLTTWVPGTGMKSPDRLDALVWMATELNPVEDEEETRTVHIEDLMPGYSPPRYGLA
jgi:phage terminase large subunit-like protein